MPSIMKNGQQFGGVPTEVITAWEPNGDKVIVKPTSMQSIADMIYPIGSIYMSANSTSPAILFGGTWTQIQDTFLLAAGNTYNAGDTGGEAEHILTQNEIPEFSGNVSSVLMDDGQSQTASGICSVTGTRERSWSGASGNAVKRINIDFGGGLAHNNMPPYLVVYMWKRTA